MNIRELKEFEYPYLLFISNTAMAKLAGKSVSPLKVGALIGPEKNLQQPIQTDERGSCFFVWNCTDSCYKLNRRYFQGSDRSK